MQLETFLKTIPAPLGNIVETAWKESLHWVSHLDRNGWFLVFCVALAVGAFWLRGFGSRSKY
jgi:hypothetical protein